MALGFGLWAPGPGVHQEPGARWRSIIPRRGRRSAGAHQCAPTCSGTRRRRSVPLSAARRWREACVESGAVRVIPGSLPSPRFRRCLRPCATRSSGSHPSWSFWAASVCSRERHGKLQSRRWRSCSRSRPRAACRSGVRFSQSSPLLMNHHLAGADDSRRPASPAEHQPLPPQIGCFCLTALP
jgi:hypothetical protein